MLFEAKYQTGKCPKAANSLDNTITRAYVCVCVCRGELVRGQRGPPLFLFVLVAFLCLLLSHSPISSLLFLSLPSSQTSLASVPLSVPASVSAFKPHSTSTSPPPLLYLYVLPASVSIPPSRGSGPVLWLIIEIPPCGPVCVTPG